MIEKKILTIACLLCFLMTLCAHAESFNRTIFYEKNNLHEDLFSYIFLTSPETELFYEDEKTARLRTICRNHIKDKDTLKKTLDIIKQQSEEFKNKIRAHSLLLKKYENGQLIRFSYMDNKIYKMGYYIVVNNTIMRELLDEPGVEKREQLDGL